MRQRPALNSPHVGTLMTPGRFKFVEARGDWLRLSPEHYSLVQQSEGGAPYDPAVEGWCIRQQDGEAFLETPTAVHGDFNCDGCGEDPIIGDRFRCLVCENVDLCGGCSKKAPHSKEHLFQRIISTFEVGDLEVGDKLDAKDKLGEWVEGKVVEKNVSENSVKILTVRTSSCRK